MGGADLGNIGNLNSGLYTVKAIVGGQLEFYQDIDSKMWRGDLSGILYKAAFLPAALRLTLRVVLSILPIVAAVSCASSGE